MLARSRQLFEQARNRAGTTDVYLRLAGSTVRLCFAGPGLLPLLRALSHLVVDPVASVDATFCLLDGASTEVKMPSLIEFEAGSTYAHRFGFTRRGDLRGFSGDGFEAAFNYEARALSLWDGRQCQGFYLTPDARRLPSYELSSPLRTLFHWCFGQLGGQLIHSAALGTTAGGVLLAGKGGSGKSTTSLACLTAGMGFAADDYCLLEAEDPWVSSLYASAKLSWDNLDRVPLAQCALDTNLAPDRDGKAVYYLYEHWPALMARRLPVRAILLPRVGDGAHTTCREVGAREGLQALALSTMAQLPGAAAGSLSRIQRFLAQASCYELRLGTDMDEVVSTIAGFIR